MGTHFCVNIDWSLTALKFVIVCCSQFQPFIITLRSLSISIFYRVKLLQVGNEVRPSRWVSRHFKCHLRRKTIKSMSFQTTIFTLLYKWTTEVKWTIPLVGQNQNLWSDHLSNTRLRYGTRTSKISITIWKSEKQTNKQTKTNTKTRKKTSAARFVCDDFSSHSEGCLSNMIGTPSPTDVRSTDWL